MKRARCAAASALLFAAGMAQAAPDPALFDSGQTVGIPHRATRIGVIQFDWNEAGDLTITADSGDPYWRANPWLTIILPWLIEQLLDRITDQLRDFFAPNPPPQPITVITPVTIIPGDNNIVITPIIINPAPGVSLPPITITPPVLPNSPLNPPRPAPQPNPNPAPGWWPFN